MAVHPERHGDHWFIRSSHWYGSALLRFDSRLHQPSCVGGVRYILQYRPIHPKGFPDCHSRLSSGLSLRWRRVSPFSPQTEEVSVSGRIFGVCTMLFAAGAQQAKLGIDPRYFDHMRSTMVADGKQDRGRLFRGVTG